MLQTIAWWQIAPLFVGRLVIGWGAAGAKPLADRPSGSSSARVVRQK